MVDARRLGTAVERLLAPTATEARRRGSAARATMDFRGWGAIDARGAILFRRGGGGGGGLGGSGAAFRPIWAASTSPSSDSSSEDDAQ